MDANTQNVDLSSLMSDRIANPPAIVQKMDEIGSMRRQAIAQVAASTGIEAGLSARANSINQMLDEQATNLNTMFDFGAIMLTQTPRKESFDRKYDGKRPTKNIVPPVLVKGVDIFNQKSSNIITIADTSYKIEKPAALTYTAPNWRDYLYINTKPYTYKKPNSFLLPKNEGERAVWDQYVQKGWAEGQEQAQDMFNLGLDRLKHDFKGMVTYHILLAQGLVNPPEVISTNLGITGSNDGQEMTLASQEVKITVPAKLQSDPEKWKK